MGSPGHFVPVFGRLGALRYGCESDAPLTHSRVRPISDENTPGEDSAGAEPGRGDAGLDHPENVAEGKYHTLMELGRGGTAVVTAAIARGLGGFSKLVVLKRTKDEFRGHDDAVSMFLNEARLASRMNHPNVVQVYEVFEEEGLPVIVMEFLEGQSLARVLQRCLRAPEYRLEVLLSILHKTLAGLHYAHTLSDFTGKPLDIVHRDATPHNIMITYDGHVKLLDFGIAKLSMRTEETQTGVIKGKLGYMPREQVDGSSIDCRADVFAIGVLLWEVIARRRFWAGKSDPEIMRHILCDELPDIEEVTPGVDSELARICRKALAPNVEDRYDSALAFGEDVERFLSSRGGIVSSAAIAKLVSETCADLKEASKQRLDEQLAKFAEEGSEDNWDQSSGGLSRPTSWNTASRAMGAASTGTGRSTPDGYHLEPHGSQAESRASRLWLAGGLAAMVFAGVAWSSGLLSPRPEAAPSKVAILPPRVEPDRTELRLVVAATPETAALYLDGARLFSNPFTGTFPLDETDHELRVQADGYLEQVRHIKFTGDTNLVVPLLKKPEPPKRKKPHESVAPAPPEKKKAAPRPPRRRASVRAAAKPPRPVAKEAPKPKAKPGCDPPYFIDGAGIKRYRRECLGG